MKPYLVCKICRDNKKYDGVQAGEHARDTGHNTWNGLFKDKEDEPPSSMDIASRCISAFSVLCGGIQKYAGGMDTICFIHGANLRRRSFNL